MSTIFTQDQQKAISFFPSPRSEKKHLIIEAGAGAGKTQVLTERVKWLIQKAPAGKRIKSEHLFLVTFTNDAQIELKERVEQALPDAHIHISTIDSLFAMLVDCIFPNYWENRKEKNSPIPPKISLISERAASRMMEKSVLQFLNSQNVTPKELEWIVDFILAGGFKKRSLFTSHAQSTMDSILKCMCQDIFIASDPKHIRIASKRIHPATEILVQHIHHIARQEYHNRLSRGEMTYADRTVFLKENLNYGLPFILKELIVDEYQDTNQIQHEILFRMVQDSKARMIVVGDPKQSIYGFRGASVDVFKNLTHDPTWNHIILNQNFRSESALLEQINLLSQITFDWTDPRQPQGYEDSFFCRQAQKKHVASSPLISRGASSQDQDQEKKHIHVICSSVSSDKKSQFKLKEYALHSYCDFLKKFQSHYHIPWHDMVILCEKNRQIQELIPVLQSHDIPIANYDEHANNESTDQEDFVSLALCKYLSNQSSKVDLYLIFNSPLCPCDHEETGLFFSQGVKSNLVKQMLACLEKHKEFAKDHIFLAWQLARWELVKMHRQESSQKKAFLFCANMDFFAHSFSHEVENTRTRMLLESGDAAFPLSDDISHWDIKKMSHHPLSDRDGIELKTVHGAKGLQWPVVCFYPKYGAHYPAGEFILAQSGEHLDVTWLNTDTEKLSVVQRIENEKFWHDDFCMEKDKPIWFSVLRKQSEENFERQRVFYTAFTRAEKHLILLQPAQSGTTKSGFLDLDKKSKTTTLLQKENYLEKEVYKKYLAIAKEAPEVCSYDSSTDTRFIPKLKPCAKTDEKSQEIQISFAMIPTSPVQDLDAPESWETEVENTLFTDVLERIQRKKEQTKKIHDGIVYHASAENKAVVKKSFQFELEHLAEKYWHELEVWKKTDPKQMDSTRHIIDLVLLFSKENFLGFFPQFLSHIKDDHVILVLDFKTGLREETHKTQIQRYLDLVKSIDFGIRKMSYVGCLYYNKDKTMDFIL